MKESKYINFLPSISKKRTRVWSVVSKSGEDLGVIKWYPHWRGYCFFTEKDILSVGCLDDIKNFIEEHKNDRVVQLPPEYAKLNNTLEKLRKQNMDTIMTMPKGGII